MEGVIGYVTLFAGNFAPRNWAFCQGQLIAISQNTALFSILGTTYGGNGQTTFALPDLRGRVAVGAGQGPGLSPYSLGQVGGTPTTTILITELAAHTHGMTVTAKPAASSTASQASPINGVYAQPANGSSMYHSGDNLALFAPVNGNLTVSPTGSGQPFSNQDPYLGLNYIVCMQGIFPARN
jgi:microcystin-dependent protein